jgi:hypothetical protein
VMNRKGLEQPGPYSRPLFTRVRGRGGLRSLNPEGRMGGFLEIPEVKPPESPVGFLAPLLRDPSEAGRRQPRGSERVSGVHSLSAL